MQNLYKSLPFQNGCSKYRYLKMYNLIYRLWTWLVLVCDLLICLIFIYLSFLNFEPFFLFYVWVSCCKLCLYTTCQTCTHKGQERAPDPQQLESQMVLSCSVDTLNRTGSSGRTARVLDHQPHSDPSVEIPKLPFIMDNKFNKTFSHNSTKYLRFP